MSNDLNTVPASRRTFAILGGIVSAAVSAGIEVGLLDFSFGTPRPAESSFIAEPLALLAFTVQHPITLIAVVGNGLVGIFTWGLVLMPLGIGLGYLVGGLSRPLNGVGKPGAILIAGALLLLCFLCGELAGLYLGLAGFRAPDL